jgi:hypothetical protein
LHEEQASHSSWAHAEFVAYSSWPFTSPEVTEPGRKPCLDLSDQDRGFVERPVTKESFNFLTPLRINHWQIGFIMVSSEPYVPDLTLHDWCRMVVSLCILRDYSFQKENSFVARRSSIGIAHPHWTKTAACRRRRVA